ncbi:hypothetical protein [Rhizobium sp. C1]|uniref:hypothetical protein n=1 Tax=Rhizobium sp. C1 TaxID=1349799 RepID=UPI001E632CB6|nr:hypothetical protein [Rhizobium sp. C1]MCD2177359.1 hypothetical protein [Rhizobium sp. C1]
MSEKKPWTYDERDYLVNALIAGQTVRQIAKHLGRCTYSVSTMFSKIGAESEADGIKFPDRSKAKNRKCTKCRLPIFSAHSGYRICGFCKLTEDYRCS